MQSSAGSAAVIMFFVVIAVTLVITYWAAKRSHSTSQLYAAGGNIKGWQNGFAIAGDLISASTVLGGVGMYYASGYDTNIYFVCSLAGLAFTLALIAGPLRRMGRFTFADVTSARLSPVPMRIFSSISALAVTLMYLIGQMIGAGGLIEILFGIPYTYAVILIGGLMVVYVAFGGMLATTWVQIIKAIVLVFAMVLLSTMVLAEAGFSLGNLYGKAEAVHKLGRDLFLPGGMNMSTLAAASLAIALILGTPGMPHILMRFFTVRNPHAARQSLIVAMIVIGLVYTLVFSVVGVGAVAFITGNADYMTEAGGPRGGTNMILLHLADYVSGDLLLGLIAAVAFATILAVVAGLNVAASSAISHDLYASVFKRGKPDEKKEAMVFRLTSIVIGAVAILLGIAFEGQNIIYLTGMLYSIAASACFPVLLMCIYWKRLTTIGAVTGGSVGLLLSVGLMVIGPNIWVQILGNQTPIFPIDNPAIVSVPAAFIVMIVVSLLTREEPNHALAEAPAE
jgi:cation/acetate symporter